MKLLPDNTARFIVSILAGFILISLPKSLHAQPKAYIKSVSITHDDIIRIEYDVDGNYFYLDALTVRYYEDLDNPNVFEEIEISSPDPPIGVVELANIAPDKVLHFQLFKAIIDGQSYFSEQIHSAIYLQEAKSLFEDCSLGVQLSWMNYNVLPNLNPNAIPKPPIFDGLDVLVFEWDGSQCDLSTEDEALTVVPQPMWDSQEFVQLNDPGEYCFQIRSRDSQTNLTATSNVLMANIEEMDLFPNQLGIRKVDIVDNEVNVHVLADEFGFDQFEYSLFRSDRMSDGFSKVSAKLHDSEFFVFQDPDALDLQSHPWYYYVEADLAGCPGHGLESDTVSSLFLQATPEPSAGGALGITLEWEHTPPDGAFDYEIYRKLPADQNLDYLMDCHTGNCNDDIPADQLGGAILYQLMASDGNVTIHSNLVMVSLEPFGEMPNAFRPASGVPENTEFLPNILLPPIEYHFEVYNRHGIRMFSSTNHLQAWTGDFQGQEAPEGAYYYRVRFTDISGDKHDLRGVVYLIR